jgi:hypothetical protein
MVFGGAWLPLGCRGGSHFDGVEYRDDQVAFRLGPVPPGSHPLRANDALLAFDNARVGSTIAISARCSLESDDIPLRALVAHLFLQLTDRKVLAEREFHLDGRSALEVEQDASLDGVSRHFVVVVVKKDGCVYDLWHIDRGGDAPELVEARADFRAMVAGFRVLPRS